MLELGEKELGHWNIQMYNKKSEMKYKIFFFSLSKHDKCDPE